MDLFSKGNPVYVIDTSALLRLEFTFKKNNPVFAAIWEEIEELIAYHRLVTLDFVEEEVNRYRGKEVFLKKWMKKWRRRLVVETDAASFNAARQIINEEYYSGFLKPNKQAEGKEEADPFLIAYCKVHHCVLITDENKEKPNRIPAVAEKNGVECIDVYDFFKIRGLRMERKK